jgi:broad-specificity NMP kinase
MRWAHPEGSGPEDRMTRPIALTGTPGTGKSTVARHLSRLRTIEVADLARSWGFARPRAGSLEVDVPALVRAARPPRSLAGFDVVVGHLAHFLPLRDVVVLRTDPLELDRRLRRSPRGGDLERRENVTAEATDLVRWEAVRPGRRVLQVDTTGKTPSAVAREVARFVRTRRSGKGPRIDWLSDPRVTDYLLDRTP